MIRLKADKPTRMGVTVENKSIHIQTVLHGRSSCGILLYSCAKPKKDPLRLDFTEDCRIGDVWCVNLVGVDPALYFYRFHEDGKPVDDPYARSIVGHRFFGEAHEKGDDAILGFRFCEDHFRWREDHRPERSYEESIFYELHPRGFTMDPSSNVREKGTFLGIQRKIPYLQKLGITALILQPSYEFEECVVRKLKSPYEKPMKQQKILNYWGYMPGRYFAPKNAYSFSEDAVTEFKQLIRTLHQHQLELLMQFYFDEETTESQIEEILEYWTITYHVDGFQLLGRAVDTYRLSQNPYLRHSKILINDLDPHQVDQRFSQAGKTFASVSRGFQDSMRCFLKGDENTLPAVTYHLRHNASEIAIINYIAAHEGFRLYDLYAYERKHNEDNGEMNADGENYNNCWNCGEEGESKKRNIMLLRTKLRYNAFACLLLSQGTPLIYMGDESGKSSGGNNNPYCQDNEISWKQWKLTARQKAQLSFVIALIAFRKAHPMLHLSKECSMMDRDNTGYPDLSFHGIEAWKPDLSYYMRTIAMLCNGAYAKEGKVHLYIMLNMHWEKHVFAMPRLGYGNTWEKVIDTSLKDPFAIPATPQIKTTKAQGRKNDQTLQEEIEARSVQVYISTDREKNHRGTH
ncbi:MAG: alpha-amylase [Lachnospiraceae bacterium]|nr:alpha-amylase [Lachnospiraceae bacterium]